MKIATVQLEEWIFRFGPPEKQLRDSVKNFTGKLINNMSSFMVTKNIFTRPYNPQADVCIEILNQALIRDMMAYISTEESDLNQHNYMELFSTTLQIIMLA